MPGVFLLCMCDELQWDRASGQRDPLTHAIIGCAIKVHRKMRRGLREVPYEDCLYFALTDAGLKVQRQHEVSANFEGHSVKRAYRPDLIVCRQVVIEIKCVPQFKPEHDAQLLTYMRFAKIERGLLLNFHARTLAAGVRRLILTPTNP